MAPSDPRLCVRVPGSLLARVDRLAAKDGTDRSRVVRRLLEAGLAAPPPPPEPLSEAEIIALLDEKARAGNVAALSVLLAREKAKDPRERAIQVLEEMAAERRQ